MLPEQRQFMLSQLTEESTISTTDELKPLLAFPETSTFLCNETTASLRLQMSFTRKMTFSSYAISAEASIFEFDFFTVYGTNS